MWWISLAMAQAPTELATSAPVSAEQLEDVAAWEGASRRLLDGPDACVELVGTARIDIAVYLPGGWLGPGEQRKAGATGTFRGRLDHGTWTSLDAEFVQDADNTEITIDEVHPMVGRRLEKEGPEQGHVSIGTSSEGTKVDVGTGSGRTLGLIDQIIEDIDPSVTTAYALWDEASRAVVLRQFVPLDESGRDELEIRTVFPEAGDPSALDVVLPRRMTFTEDPLRIRVINSQMHLRGHHTALGMLPAVESASLVVGVLGFTLGFEQRLTYERARGCE